MKHSISRRKALFSALGILLPGSLSSGLAWITSPYLVDLEGFSLWRQVSALFDSPHSMCAVGWAYLSTREAKAPSVARSTRLLLELKKQLQRPASEWRPWLRQRVSLDFEEDRVVHLEGWVLSETELGLCALFAMAR